MIVAGSASPLLLSSGGYNLTKSLRFRSSASAYLSRTPASAGNRKTWTWSAWVKRGAIADGVLFSVGTSGSSYFNLRFQDNSGVQEFSAVSENPSTDITLRTSQQFRDPSAWYHLVFVLDTTQATSSNRAKFYVNGSQVTAFSSATYPSQNADLLINNNQAHNIARRASASDLYFDGYMTEINFIDGQALTPSSFGETSTSTGVWIPKKYTGTYGTNGFYLPFTDVATTSGSNAGLGKDFSGNGNYWTTNNISVTSGSTYDSMKDVPTLTDTDTANYCTWNPIEPNAALGGGTTEANLLGYPSNTANTGQLKATINFPTTGKFYFEITPTVLTSATAIIGILKSSIAVNTTPSSAGDIYAYQSDGNKWNGSATASYGATYTVNDVIGVAFDIGGGTITFYKNGVSQGQAYTGITGEYIAAARDGTAGGVTQYAANFGQRPFAYTPPSGFVALNTFNLPTPTIGATASSQANKYMDATLYTGNGSYPRNITGLGFQPDFVWVKARNQAYSHILYDVLRGTGNTKNLSSDLTSAEPSASTNANLTSFNSDGFTVDTTSSTNILNANTITFVAWNWKANGSGSTNTAGSITSTVSANTTAGFSIVTYTGTGANATVGHGLGVAPSMIIVKRRSTSGSNWITYHSSLANPSGNYLSLNTTDAAINDNTAWNNTNPTSSVFSLGTLAAGNLNTGTFVAYCFAQVAGYSAFGSYTGNGSSDGPFVFTGFRPAFVMVKGYTGTSSNTTRWLMLDDARNPYNAVDAWLYANLSNAEATLPYIDFLSNGFKFRDNNLHINQSGISYIYMAFAESPFKYANAR